MKTFFNYVLLFGLATAQFQPPPDQSQQSQFGSGSQQQQGQIDPRQQQQQQFPGQPQQQQFPSNQQPQQPFPGQQQQQFPGGPAPGQPLTGQQFGQQQPPQQNFGTQPSSADQFGAPQNPNQPNPNQLNPNQNQNPNQMQGQQQFGGPQQPTGVGQQGVGPSIKITADLFPVDVAQHATQLMWSEPRSDAVYCVSTQPVTNLQFFCFDCNSSYAQTFNELLQKNTQNYQQATNYPAIKLNSLPIVGEELYTKTLTCVGYYGQSLNASASSSINIQFLSTPRILDSQAHGPLYGPNPQDGFQFYVPAQGFPLMCYARGNPQPVSYNWTINGAPIPSAGNGPSLSVDSGNYAGKAVSCRAYSQAYQHGKESAPVGIMTWVGPLTTANNFQELQKSATLYEPGTTQVQLGKSATFMCAATGLPVPWIWWRQEVSNGYVVNATCEGNRPDSAPTANQNGMGWAVSSQCTIPINNYAKTGRYWCSACNYLSAGTYSCNPSEGPGAPQNGAFLRIDVIGGPLIAQDEPPRYEQVEDGTVKVGVTYCANPEPQLPDGIYWQVNGQRLNIRSEMDNYVADAPELNATVPNCWIARIRVRHASSADRAKRFRLTVTNQMGTVYREFQLDQLNATSSADEEQGRIGLAVGLTLGLFFLILLILCAFCWWRKLLCFGNVKRQTPTPQQKKTKPKPNEYQTNVAPDTIRSTPGGLSEKVPPSISRPPYDLPPSEPVHGGASSPGGRRKHEGLNYAELDLVKDSHRPLQPTPAAVSTTQHRPGGDYTRFQPQPPSSSQTQLKSPTNSTV